jgi:hypothetical protein
MTETVLAVPGNDSRSLFRLSDAWSQKTVLRTARTKYARYRFAQFRHGSLFSPISETVPTVFGSIIARWAAKILRGLRVGRRREKCDVNVAGTCHVGSGDAATGEAKAMRCDRDVTRQPVAA